ncbi:MAG: hypothetical protein JNM32_09435 [Dechloromonas sp.]|jgi:hypothetical protein|nr:hypothetical protein [Dechloromonas sp.]
MVVEVLVGGVRGGEAARPFRYVSAKMGPWSRPGRFDRFLAALHFPKSDQRFYTVATSITDWWLELNELHQPQREIAFDPQGRALYISPYRADIQIFLNVGCSPEEVLGEVDPLSFEREWQAMVLRLG